MIPDDPSDEVYVQLFSAEASQQNANIAKTSPERATLRKVKDFSNFKIKILVILHSHKDRNSFLSV